MISLIRRPMPGSGTTRRRSWNITRARVKHRTAGGVGSQSACFPDTHLCSLFISILQASVTAAPVRRKRHHRRTNARSVERNVCADHQRRNYETDPILRALNGHRRAAILDTTHAPGSTRDLLRYVHCTRRLRASHRSRIVREREAHLGPFLLRFDFR